MFENVRYHELTPELELQVRNLHAVCQKVDGFGQDLFLDKTLNSHPALEAYHGVLDRGNLVGFAFLFCPRRHEVEVTAFVHPDHRKQGVFKSLLDAIRPMAASRGVRRMLLVNDRKSVSGCKTAEAMGFVLNHSEYAMRHERSCVVRPASALESTRLEPCRQEWVKDVIQIKADAFDVGNEEAAEMVNRSMADRSRELHVLVRVVDEVSVGVVGIKREEGKAYIYGLAVDVPYQGQGYGKALVSHLLKMLDDCGVKEICLDVDSLNAPAYALYRSCGFEAQETIDYFVEAIGSVEGADTHL